MDILKEVLFMFLLVVFLILSIPFLLVISIFLEIIERVRKPITVEELLDKRKPNQYYIVKDRGKFVKEEEDEILPSFMFVTENGKKLSVSSTKHTVTDKGEIVFSGYWIPNPDFPEYFEVS